MTSMAAPQQQVKKTPPATVLQPGSAQPQSAPPQQANASSTPSPAAPKKPTPSRMWGIIGFACMGGAMVWCVYHQQSQLIWLSLMVWGLLGGMMLLGFAAVCRAIGNVSRSRAHFEKQRVADIEFSLQNHHGSVKARVRDAHFAPFLPGGSIAASSRHRMHHVDRLQIILHIVQQDETEVTMPALDDLRTHSYSVEKALWHNWVLRIVISVLLITGILGTLAGVHASMDGASGVNIKLLPQAFLPSLVAVAASSILILLQAWYRYLFEAYLGRLDCHTLRYYFPWFRPDVLNAQSLKQFESSYGQLSEALKRLGQDIKHADNIPAEMNKVAKEIRTMQKYSQACASRESVNVWLAELKMKVNGISAQVGTVQEQQAQWAETLQQLEAATEFSLQDWDKARKLCGELKNQERKMEEVKAALTEVVNPLPGADELNEKLKAAESNLSFKVYEIACNSERLLEERYGYDVSQAKVSQESISEIKQECLALSSEVQGNVQRYRTYVQELKSGYTRSEEAVGHSRKDVVTMKNKLGFMRERLEARIADYDNEPILHKWQIVMLCAMVAAFVINLSITIIIL